MWRWRRLYPAGSTTPARYGRWRWRWRVERERFLDSLRGPRLYANPRIGFVALIAVWAAGVLFGLLTGPGKTLNVFAGAVLNTALISVTFGAFLYFGSNRRLARRLRTLARTHPEALLSGEATPGLRMHGARSELYADIAQDLSDVTPVGPQLIVGEVGAGKTTALVGLARFLAERGMVPVYVTLRGADDLDFLELARERFVEHVDEHVATEADAARVWRWLCRSHRVAVLADDLDQSRPLAAGEGADVYAARRALGVARQHKLALAVTARPVAIPESLALSAVALEPLSDAAAVSEVLRDLPAAGGALGGRVQELVRAGRLGAAPFYLEVCADLAQVDALPEPHENRDVVRFRLLCSWEAALRARRLATEAPLGPQERALCMRMLRALALDRLDSLEMEFSLSHVIATLPAGDPLHLIDGAERLGLIERGPGTVRFVHEIVQSYLAAAALRESERQLRQVCQRAGTTRAVNAVVLAAAGAQDASFAARAAGHLVACAREREGDWGLMMLRAAADAARTAPDGRADALVIKAARRYAPADEGPAGAPPAVAGSLTKRVTVPRLAQMRIAERWHLIWDFTNDADYGVKWQAASELRAAAVDAYETLHDRFDVYLADARELHERTAPQAVDDWRDRPVFRLKMLGWVLPSLATSLERAGRRELAAQADRQWAELSELERAPITFQKGLEASISQGLKVDALAMRAVPRPAPAGRLALARERAFAMLATAGFWYTRIQLVHALALLANDQDLEVAQRLGELTLSAEEHPFAAQAARLVLHSLRSPDWRAEVWEDEGEVVRRRCELSDEAAQLVADITLLLNLNEQGDEAQRAEFGRATTLPHCLSHSRDRAEILGRRPCPPSCPLQRCPYYRPTTETAHRELSKAFCREQRRIAQRSTPRAWQRIGRPELSAFWQEMEERARA